mmetsp:Transcript_453/g.732  ORF Transcript_453/g.732 Transcript_453/m.732 type:complete len:209 (-) Transcript_453:54-680(-)
MEPQMLPDAKVPDLQLEEKQLQLPSKSGFGKPLEKVTFQVLMSHHFRLQTPFRLQASRSSFGTALEKATFQLLALKNQNFQPRASMRKTFRRQDYQKMHTFRRLAFQSGISRHQLALQKKKSLQSACTCPSTDRHPCLEALETERHLASPGGLWSTPAAAPAGCLLLTMPAQTGPSAESDRANSDARQKPRKEKRSRADHYHPSQAEH